MGSAERWMKDERHECYKNQAPDMEARHRSGTIPVVVLNVTPGNIPILQGPYDVG